MKVIRKLCMCILLSVTVCCAKDLCKWKFGNDIQITTSSNPSLSRSLVCNNSQNPISLRIKQKEGHRYLKTKVVIRRCPSVHGVWLHLPGSDNSITSVRPTNGIVTSCNGTNNTFILTRNKRGHRDKFVLTTFLHASDDIDFLIFTYDVKIRGTVDSFTYKIDIPRENDFLSRRKREAATVLEKNSLRPRGCGDTRSCIRFGSKNCAHMECQYFLSYRRIGSTNIEIELSGKTMGWVAIGFSSDDSMGGNDDVLVCKRKTDYKEDIEAVAMTNIVHHARPEPKNSDFNLTSARFRDGFIYCKIVRPLKINLDGHLDLFNDWYQLYARGQITSTGVMLQHEDIPPTSKSKITVLISENIQNSMATRHCFIPYFIVMVTSIVSFYVS